MSVIDLKTDFPFRKVNIFIGTFQVSKVDRLFYRLTDGHMKLNMMRSQSIRMASLKMLLLFFNNSLLPIDVTL